MMEKIPNGSTLALDVGTKRVGVAVAAAGLSFGRPVTTLLQGPEFYDQLHAICKEYDVTTIVCGLPRNLSGDETAQTGYSRQVALQVEQHTGMPVYLIDEAVTSEQAETELKSRGKPYAKADIDALAATYILEDFLQSHATAERVQA